MADSTFSAKEPSLGYFYQVLYGLLLLITSKEEENAKVLIESLDDIELQTDKTELYQSKYHSNRNANLTDRSSDFWKTLRVWSEQILDNTIDIDNTLFTLITTENISSASVIFDIKNKDNTDDCIKEIIKKLDLISKELDKNAINKKGYIAYNKLSSTQKKILIKNLYLVDSSLDFEDINKKIKAELRLSTIPKNVEYLFEKITGWFLLNTIDHLQDKKDFISFIELQEQIHSITDKLKEDNLPTDFPDKISLTEDELKKVNDFKFIKQLNLINISSRMQKTAISDYYRAFRQKSKWLRENLLNPQEEIDYDRKLIDDWNRKFDVLVDDSETLANNTKSIKGKAFYRKFYIDTIPRVFIRERFNETYLIIGSCHMLADRLKIGWHPNFEELLKDEK